MLSGTEPRGVRSFVAVLLPEGVRAALHEATAPLRREAPRVAWVRVENLHVTVRFLGELEAAAVSRVQAALAAATATSAPFRVTLAGLGGFPTSRAPRVVWAGVVAGAAELFGLHGRLEASLARQGMPPEGRAFHPHVTLGRVRNPRGEPALARLLETAAGPFGEARAGEASFGEAMVEALHLMRSDLGRGGARHRVVSAAGLGVLGY